MKCASVKSPTQCLRLGLSRLARVKPLHPNATSGQVVSDKVPCEGLYSEKTWEYILCINRGQKTTGQQKLHDIVGFLGQLFRYISNITEFYSVKCQASLSATLLLLLYYLIKLTSGSPAHYELYSKIQVYNLILCYVNSTLKQSNQHYVNYGIHYLKQIF